MTDQNRRRAALDRLNRGGVSPVHQLLGRSPEGLTPRAIHKGLLDGLRGLLDAADGEQRDLTADERVVYDEGIAAVDGYRDLIDRGEGDRPYHYGRPNRPTPEGGNRRTYRPGEVVVLGREQRMAEYLQDIGVYEPRGLDAGKWLKGVLLGDWRDAALELEATRALSVGADISGGYLVPTELAARIIDVARNMAAVFRAGAQTVPMETAELPMARADSDPTAGWKAENAAGTASDINLSRVTLRARTVMSLVKMSLELFEDAPNVGDLVERMIGEAIGLELDRAALVGQAAGLEPTGVRYDPGVTVTNTSAAVSKNNLMTAIERVWKANFSPTGIIWAQDVQADFERLEDANQNPLTLPPTLAALPKYMTKQVPVSGGASDIFIADWTKLLVGLRTQLTIEATRTGADSDSSAFTNLQVWIRGYVRADVALERGAAFDVSTVTT